MAERGFEGCGATQAVGDAGEDDGEVSGAEGSGEEHEAWGGSAELNRACEVFAEVDQFADEAEDAAEAAGYGCGGLGWIGICGWGGELGGGRHEQNKNMGGEGPSRKMFLR